MRFNVMASGMRVQTGTIFKDNVPSEIVNGNWIIDNIDPVAQYVFCDSIGRNCYFTQGSNLYDGMDIELLVNNKKKVAGYVIAGTLALLLLRRSKQKNAVGEITKEQARTGLYIGLGILGVMFAKKLLQTFGVIDSKETIELDKAAVDPGSFWNPNFYKKFSFYTYAIDTNQARELARKIYNSFGIFNDCEECAKSVFFGLKTKSNVSFLVKVFADEYGQDLLSFLRGGIWPQDRLSDKDVAEINTYVSKLPNA